MSEAATIETAPAAGIGTFEKWLSLWVAACIATGVLLGNLLPGVFGFLASLELASLLHKPARARTPVHIDYLGFTIDDVFVVGYGLDHAQRLRNLPYLGVLEES